MAALLTGSGRPGFYFRVLEEGEVGAGDAIVPVARGPEQMTVTEVNALLYSSRHPRDQLERVLRIPALSPGWRWSFEALLRDQAEHPGATGNAGLVPEVAARTAAPGFRPLRVSRIDRECVDVISLSLEPADGRRLTAPLPGQFVVMRLHPSPEGPSLFRSYSLSGPLSDERYRVSVKLEPNGAGGAFLGSHVHPGDIIDVSEPRGSFVLQPGGGPVVLLSAGIGATPVLAMLHSLAAGASPREILVAARHSQPKLAVLRRRGATSRRAARPRAKSRLVQPAGAGRWAGPGLRHARSPGDRGDRAARCAARRGLLSLRPIRAFSPISGTGLAGWGVSADRIHSEIFSGGPSLTPGVVGATASAAASPAGAPGTGPRVSFARSGLTVRWRPSQDQSLLELAEACDVPVRWSCRTGVCHNCESGLISGNVDYQPDPLDPPASGNVLLCCARPERDVVIDI